jgi:hypothetical protein
VKGRQLPCGRGAPFHVIGALLLVLGIGAVDSGLVVTESLQEEVPGKPRLQAVTVSPGTAASPLAAQDQFRGDPSCRVTLALSSRPAPTVLPLNKEDPRGYLSKMAALRYGRQTASTAPDPYQASLNPSVYFIGAGASPKMDETPRQDIPDQRCTFP